MAKTTRLFKSFYRLLLPVTILLVVAVIAASVLLVHTIAQPPSSVYLVTPEKYAQFSTRGAKITDETWANHDGTQARGWLLRGAENAPAVILLHRYGTDRSHVLDLGVKINEATNFTVLMPDQRGHGQNPSVRHTSLGGCETEDALASIRFLRGVKTDAQTNLVGKNIGFYAVEMGAFAAVNAAAQDQSVTALALDSVPADSESLLASAIGKKFPFASSVTSKIANFGTHFYFYDGCYNRNSLCDQAQLLSNRKILLLAGADAPAFQNSTANLKKCLNASQVEIKTDLNPSGYSLTNASLEQIKSYDQRVIDFFTKNLGN